MEPITIVLIAAASFVLVAMMVFFAIKPKKAWETNSSFQNGKFVGQKAPWAAKETVPAAPAAEAGQAVATAPGPVPVRAYKNGDKSAHGRPFFKSE